MDALSEVLRVITLMGITACVVDSTGGPPPFCPVGLGDIQLDNNALAEDVTWKDTIVNTLITEANENGYSLTAGDVVIFSMERAITSARPGRRRGPRTHQDERGDIVRQRLCRICRRIAGRELPRL